MSGLSWKRQRFTGEIQHNQGRMEPESSPLHFPRNLQAIAENNYIKLREEKETGETELFVCHGGGETVHRASSASVDPSESADSNTIGQLEGMDGAHKIPEHFMISAGDFDDVYDRKHGRRKGTTDHGSSLPGASNPGPSNPCLSNPGPSLPGPSNPGPTSGKSDHYSVDTDCPDRPSTSGVTVQLEQSDYIDMLTLPVNMRASDKGQTLAEGDVSADGQGTSDGASVSEGPIEYRRLPGECFKVNLSTTSCGSINYLPASILVQVFKNLTVHGLLRRTSLVCKYWYNLSRDPDLWLNISLVNQHRLNDRDLKKLIDFGEGRMRCVNLTDCRFINSQGVQDLVRSCPNLQILKLMRCFNVTDVAFKTLYTDGHCQNLRALYLDGCCKITDTTVIQVAKSCPQLRCLQLNQCTKVSDASITEVARCCPLLGRLQLDHCTQVTDEGICQLVTGCPDIHYLNLMSCSVSDVSINYLARLSNLSNIDLANITRLQPESVINMSKYCKNLHCVNVSLNSVINDECVTELAVNLPKLTRLYCVSCNISDRGLEALARHCTTLEALDVGWCQDITDQGIKLVSSSCTKLTYLGLIRCDNISMNTIETLALTYPRINYSTFILESRRLIERAKKEGYKLGLT